jgi:hypothetical protein
MDYSVGPSARGIGLPRSQLINYCEKKLVTTQIIGTSAPSITRLAPVM